MKGCIVSVTKSSHLSAVFFGAIFRPFGTGRQTFAGERAIRRLCLRVKFRPSRFRSAGVFLLKAILYKHNIHCEPKNTRNVFIISSIKPSQF